MTMAALKGSKTEGNLKAAFAGESQANRRYLYFAQKADVEGFNDVAAVFRDHETYSTRPYLRIFTDVIGPTMVQMDGSDHDVRRAIVLPFRTSLFLMGAVVILMLLIPGIYSYRLYKRHNP